MAATLGTSERRPSLGAGCERAGARFRLRVPTPRAGDAAIDSDGRSAGEPLLGCAAPRANRREGP